MSAGRIPAQVVNPLAGKQPGLPTNLYVTDDELIETQVALGQPRWSAVELRGNPSLRLAAMRCWADVQEEARGDKAAKQRLDYVREAYQCLRSAELIADDPRRTV